MTDTTDETIATPSQPAAKGKADPRMVAELEQSEDEGASHAPG